MRFGLHYVDYNDPSLKRYAKASAIWYRDFLSSRPNFGRENTPDDNDEVIISSKEASLTYGVSVKESFIKISWFKMISDFIVNSNGAIVYGPFGIFG